MTPEQRERHNRVRRRAPLLTVNTHGHTIRMHNRGGKIARCWQHGTFYEMPLLRHLHEQRFTGLAVDAGANIGNHTLWLAAVCGLDVAAFEPLTHEALAANVALNGLNVRVEPVALGARDDTAVHTSAGRLTTGAGNLPVRTLDSYALTDVSVVKIDVEGMEPDVLQGGEKTIRRDRPVIVAEEHNQAEHDAIAAVLQPWGYRMTRRFHGRGQATPVGRWDMR